MATSEFLLVMEPERINQVVHIDQAQYHAVHAAILENLHLHGPMNFHELSVLIKDQFQHDFDGPIIWYYTMVRLDMESCGEIRRSGPDSSIIEIGE